MTGAESKELMFLIPSRNQGGNTRSGERIEISKRKSVISDTFSCKPTVSKPLQVAPLTGIQVLPVGDLTQITTWVEGE